MNYNPHDGEQKPEAEKTPCGCLICKIGQTIQAHYPGDPNRPIPPSEMADMRNALATVSGALMLGASREEVAKFAQDMQEGQRRARTSAIIDAMFDIFRSA